MQQKLETVLQNILALYDRIIEATIKETYCLANIKLDCLNVVIKAKKTLVKEIFDFTKQVIFLLKQNNKTQYFHYIKAVKELSTKLGNLDELNFQMAQQHVAFSQYMINIYLGFQANQIYDNKCLILYKGLRQG